jgi:hypothetical protein
MSSPISDKINFTVSMNNESSYQQVYEVFKKYTSNIPENFLKKVIEHPNNIICKLSIKLEENENLLPVIKTVIGSKGHYLFMTTKNQNVDFIWYNKDTHTFEIWGDNQENCKKAEQIIVARLNNKYMQVFSDTDTTTTNTIDTNNNYLDEKL